MPEPANPVDHRAVLVTSTDDVRLGYVPTPLLDLVCAIEGPETRVLRANGPEVGFHYRLLVRSSGVVCDGATPFAGPDWEAVD